MSVDELLEAYAAAGGEVVEPARVRWWQVYATVKWAVICALQASAHLSGATRSVELAAIGRRVCESEWDLLALLGLVPDAPAGEDGPVEDARAEDGPVMSPTPSPGRDHSLRSVPPSVGRPRRSWSRPSVSTSRRA